MRLNSWMIFLLGCGQLFCQEHSNTESRWNTKKILATGVIAIGAGCVAVAAAPAVGTAAVAGATVVTGAKATVVTIAVLKKAAVGVLVVRCVWPVGKSVKEYFYPTDEQRIKQMEQEDWYRKPLEQQIVEHRACVAASSTAK